MNPTIHGTSRLRIRSYPVAAGLVLVLLAASSGAQAQADALFQNVEPGADADGREVDANRRVRIDVERLAEVRAHVRDGTTGSLTLNLFDDVVFTATVVRTAPTSSGGYSLTGRLQGVEFGAMTADDGSSPGIPIG